MRILIAPDKFKGTMSAATAARAIERGLSSVLPKAEFRRLPLADGGEGTAAVLGEPRGSLCVEVASTSGRSTQADALRASSEVTGHALSRALDEDPERLLVAVGGSSSTDGGTGLARALGWRFLDRDGREIPTGGGPLRGLARILDTGARRPNRPVIGLCDVANPLLGPTGAARVFGPQKGASPRDVELLELGLARLAEVLRSQLGLDVTGLAGGGAGGGIGAGLAAFLQARLVDGFSFVAETIDLTQAAAGSDVIVTGEGRLDEGSRAGKVAAGVARMARAREIPAFAVCGEISLSARELGELGLLGWSDAVSIVGEERALTAPEEALEAAARGLAERWDV